MHLNGPGYALVVIPLLYLGVWRLSELRLNIRAVVSGTTEPQPAS